MTILEEMEQPNGWSKVVVRKQRIFLPVWLYVPDADGDGDGDDDGDGDGDGDGHTSPKAW